MLVSFLPGQQMKPGNSATLNYNLQPVIFQPVYMERPERGTG
jgi:hypothetical protein